MTGRPGESLPPADFEATRAANSPSELGYEPSGQEIVSSLLYPKVFQEFAQHRREFYDPSGLPTPVFFYGPEPGEEISIELEPGKTLIIKYLTVGEPHADGRRTVFFEVNGIPREVSVQTTRRNPRRRRPSRRIRTTSNRSAPRCPDWSSPWPSKPATRSRKVRNCSAWRP